MLIEPRDYQDRAVSKIIDSYERGINRQLFVSATGTGKTYTATFLRDRFKPRKQSIFMVDQIQLAYQAKDSFINADPNLKVGIEMNKYKSSPKDDVIITSVPTIGRAGSKRINRLNPDNIGLVVVDEAHKSVSESWIRTLNYLQVGPDNFDRDKLLLGMTATPNRSDGKPLKTLYDDITENYDLRWALSNGWLTDFEFFRVDTETDISNVKKRGSEFNQKELANAVNNDERNAQIFKAYKDYSDGEPAIVYCASVDHAKYLTALFNHNGVPSAVIHANTKKSDKKEYIEKYKSGEIKVLFNYGTLTTGFDAPDTATIILARPIGSELLVQQIIGRGLRPSTDSFVNEMDTVEERKMGMRFSKKPYCKIIDFHDVTKNNNVCTPAVLFGLHKNLEPKEGDRFFKDVVEKLDKIQKEESFDVSKIENLEDIDLQVKRAKADLSSVMNVADEAKLHSNKSWVKIDEGHFEIAYSEDKKVLSVVKNKLDQYELKEYDMETQTTKTLNAFGSLSGSLNTADKYADETYDTKFDEMEKWGGDGVTAKQAKHLRNFLRWKGLKVDKNNRYEDTGQHHLHFEGELLTKGSATLLLQRLFNN